MSSMRNPIFTGLILLLAPFITILIKAASTPLQEYCVYANFSSLPTYANSYYSIAPQYNSGNWRSGQQQLSASLSQPLSPPNRLTQHWPQAAVRATPRPFAPAYPSYYLRGGNAFNGGYHHQSPYFFPQRQQQQYRPRFVRDTLSRYGFELNQQVAEDDVPVSRNIISGDPIEQKSWPFLVALLTTGDTIKIDNEYWDLVCGGTLIHPQFILTAAHCFVDEGIYTWKFMQAQEFRVRIGDYNLLVPHDVPGAVDARVLRYTAHPRYDHKVVENGYDIALIQLDRPVVYSDWIKPACLPTQQNNNATGAIPPPNVPCQVAGWGAVNNAGRLSPIPRFTTLPSSRQSLCYNSLQVPAAARDGRLFCAGDLTGKKDSCSGDSGGPIFCLRENNAWELSGIVSFGGERCAQQSIPGAYTTIAYFINWIQATTQSMLAQSGMSAQPYPSSLSSGAGSNNRDNNVNNNNNNNNNPVSNNNNVLHTKRPIYAPAQPPSRFSAWQPSLPGIGSRSPSAGVALPPPSPSTMPPPVISSNNNNLPINTGSNHQTGPNKSPAALLNLLQLLLTSFGGGSGGIASAPSGSRNTLPNKYGPTTERWYPLEIDLP